MNTQNTTPTLKTDIEALLRAKNANQFITRKIGVIPKLDRVDLENHEQFFSTQEVETISASIHTQLSSIYSQNFSELAFEQFLAQVSRITNSRLDFYIELFELHNHIPQNWPFLLQIMDKLPSLVLTQDFQMIIELANNNIQLETLNAVLSNINVDNQSFYNLYTLALKLNPDLLSFVAVDSPIFYLDTHKLEHLIKKLNRDPLIAQDIIGFINNLQTIQDTKAYVSLITNPKVFMGVQMRFINLIFKKLKDPASSKDFIFKLIINEDYISLSFYLSFFNSFNQTQLESFNIKLKKMNFIDRLKLEIRLLTNQVYCINQVING